MINISRDQLVADLAPFNDIGDNGVKSTDQSGKITVKLTRDGKPLRLVVDKESGKVQCTWGSDKPRNFSNLAAALGSEIFSNLRRWADSQRDLLKSDPANNTKLLPVRGLTHTSARIQSIEAIESILGSDARQENCCEVLLIDGPAGIGKTSVIEQLALSRAEAYKTTQKPLILHVKSRGRVLSNLLDLMAFSLQTIRSQITYDQIPILAKYGLVILAIDGFDELADPNGYEMAWAQLGDLVKSVRGRGTLILAGRDTFIGRARLLEDVDELRAGIDIVNGITLQPPAPEQARQWLMGKGWTEANFELPSISVLLEPESYALRPVFLRLLADIKPKELKNKHERYLTPLLVNHMIGREAGLFGKPVQALLNQEQREDFVRKFLCEVAREMTDSQTESLDANEIGWIAETVISDLPAEVVTLIKNRASLVAFFVNDERPGYRKFMHSYLLNFFAAEVMIKAIGDGDIPKAVRRNLLGSEFLGVFVDVIADTAASNHKTFERFWEKSSNLSMAYNNADRGLRNVGALVLGTLPAVDIQPIHLREFQLDDALIRGTVPPATCTRLEIGQLDVRGSDVSRLDWQESSVRSLLADDASLVSETFPVPAKIALPDGNEIYGSEEVENWLDSHGRNKQKTNFGGLATESLRQKPIYELLMRAARLRQHWMRAENDEYQASKIVNDDLWPLLSKVLIKHEYLRVETRQASGRSSKFYHLRHRENILAARPDDLALKAMLDELATL